MSRGWVWLQVAVAWLPIWGLFTALNVMAHQMPVASAGLGALRLIGAGAVLAIPVSRFAARTPWPHPFRIGFIALHVLASVFYATGWYVLICLIDSLVTGTLTLALGPAFSRFMLLGVWLYTVVAVVAYANLAAQRTVKIEAHAVRVQLDTLRSQLHPHFLFNALHTVVQLIPTAPRLAASTAENLAGALRTTLEERRDLIALAEEWAFVERYLAIERVRFDTRLMVVNRIAENAEEQLLPSFALQTLVENAVRHGASTRIEPTQIVISATVNAGRLLLEVADNAGGTRIEEIEHSTGTGLRRLRERLYWLYGDRAKLKLSSSPGSGFTATLTLPIKAGIPITAGGLHP